MLAQQAQLERGLPALEDRRERRRRWPRSSASSSCTRPARRYDYALYLQGLINFNDNLGILGSLAAQDLSERDQQASRDAYQSFQQLVERFPQSLVRRRTRALRMNYIVNSLAAYEVHVARYYFRRGAYVAAANRAQQAVTEFQQSPSAEEALYIMAQSYDTPRPDPAARRRRPRAAVRTSRTPRSTPTASATSKTPWWKLW